MLKEYKIQSELDFNIPFYNTTKEEKTTAFSKINHYANLSVLEVFESNPDRSFTPYEVYDVLQEKGNKMEFTSCRRAITDLETLGKIVNTRVKVMERKGRNNFKWQLYTNE